MKRLLVLSMMLALGFSVISASSWAQDDAGRTVNPGTDPNEEMKSDGASVSSVGICKECIARQKSQLRLQDSTVAPSSVGTGNGTSESADKKGSR